jgi:hypothetical protein
VYCFCISCPKVFSFFLVLFCFVLFAFETESLYVAQASLKLILLLSAWITGMCYHAQCHLMFPRSLVFWLLTCFDYSLMDSM